MHIKKKNIVGIGIGPFNLGLAALVSHHPELDAEFIERKPEFSWHNGMLLPGATLQVPFFSRSRYDGGSLPSLSYLNYLKHHDRLYQFYYYENFLVPRSEYNHYCQWASKELKNCAYGETVTDIQYQTEQERFVINSELKSGESRTRYSHDIAIGVGTVPWLPDWAEHMNHPQIKHSAEFAHMREQLARCNSVTVIGSGQSAAECVLNLYRDLTPAQIDAGATINWLTRSGGFHPMEASKLGQECFTPAYMQYFHTLPREKRRAVVKGQGLLYKGISDYTITDIFDLLYERSIGGREPGLNLYSNSQVNKLAIENETDVIEIECLHTQQEQSFTLRTEAIIVATGYTHQWPSWFENLKNSVLETDEHGDCIVEENFIAQRCDQGVGRVFIQNSEIFQHGVGTPDLGLGAYRNASIINQILDKVVYRLPEKSAFQSYGAPRG